MATIKDYFRMKTSVTESQPETTGNGESELESVPPDVLLNNCDRDDVSDDSDTKLSDSSDSDEDEAAPSTLKDSMDKGIPQLAEEKEVPGPNDISKKPSDGPYQPKLHSYPRTQYGDKQRSFCQEWFNTNPWLEYSQSTDSVYCFACRHFSSPSGNMEKSFTNTGYSNWKKAVGKSGGFAKHTHADYHKDAVVAWKECTQMQEGGTSVAQMLNTGYQTAVKKNRHFIKTLGQVILVTCTQKLAQRGHAEQPGAGNPGNVLKILELVASHDDIIKERLASGPKNAKYTSPEIQNEMILTFAEIIRKEIIQEVKDAGVFSILVDESKDVSKQEQISLVIRYFYDGEIRESFLEFRAAFQLDAESLTKSIFDILKSHGVDFQRNLVGQGYDGASVMSGKISGVAARVRKEAKYAYYVHCHAHRLNLVLVDVTKGIADAANFFSLLEKVYVYVSGSYVHSKWIEIQKEMYPGQPTRELKRLSDTRWACRVDACRVIRDRFPALIRLLEEIGNETHADRAVDARGLLGQINAEFLMKLPVITSILMETSRLPIMFQLSDVDLGKAAELTETLIADLQEMRSDPQPFNNLWDEVQVIVRDHGFDIEDVDPSRRKRKRKLPKRLEEATLLEPLAGSSISSTDELEDSVKDKGRSFTARFLTECWQS
ncbi:PREDICTED: zinc finger MYM-type protein 1-like [Priapulus caudatus]|uniref:Zinc finger MYM-type protein 1-like n=1 Tax=Priapulus caudatus TaxID=37621 RepID=A0ABM1EBQ9_PRICU|nr:PREDICTED: zinc finger MYM-type protein 1-like [Priapulus caudatus]